MLIQLLPDQISGNWEVIKYAIERSLPPIAGESPDKLNNILTSLLSSRSQCWISYEKDNDKVTINAVCITKILIDEASQTKNLLIYCLYGYTPISDESQLLGLLSIAKYAKSRRCSSIIAYTDSDKILEMVNSLEGSSSYSFISFDVNKIIKKFNNLG